MKELSVVIPVTKDFAAKFLFYQSPNTSKRRFYISVLDQQGTTHFFFLERLKENWKIQSAAKLPDWIMNLQDDLNELIAYEVDLESWHVK